MANKQKNLSGRECFRFYNRCKNGDIEYIGKYSLRNILKYFIAKQIVPVYLGEEYAVEMTDTEGNISPLVTIMDKKEVRREQKLIAKQLKKRGGAIYARIEKSPFGDDD